MPSAHTVPTGGDGSAQSPVVDAVHTSAVLPAAKVAVRVSPPADPVVRRSCAYWFAAMTLAPANAQTLNFAPAVQSPEVSGDGRVTLRLKAPNAQSVMVRRGGAPQAMAKGEDGVWSLTTEPLAPNIYHYNFIVDGLVIPDPSNPDIKLIYRNGGGDSMALVPGRNGPMPWERHLRYLCRSLLHGRPAGRLGRPAGRRPL